MSPWVPRIGLAILCAGVLGAIVSLSVGESGPRSITIEGLDDVQQTYAGIPQEDATLGDLDAPIELELFTDLRSVDAARFQTEVVEPLIEEYVRTRGAQIALRHFSIGRTEITEAALAATAAGLQGHQWQYAALVMRNLAEAGPTGADREFLEAVAKMTPQLEFEPWSKDFDDPAVRETVETDAELAADLKLPAEPAIFVTGPNGAEQLIETPTLDEVRAAIDRVG